MKHKSNLLWLSIVLGFIFLPTITNDNTELGQNVAQINKQINTVIDDLKDKVGFAGLINQNSVASSNQAGVNETPIETNVQGKTLATTYYYHYDENVSQAVKDQFNQAIKIYNQTGIVKLVSGTGTSQQNQIKFSVYRKTMTTSSLQNSIELGHGGPAIIERTGWGAYTANHATASLNIKYTNSIKLSVAVHELGHALGLDHSNDIQSVMYPTDQGKTGLTDADINALKAIYSSY